MEDQLQFDGIAQPPEDRPEDRPEAPGQEAETMRQHGAEVDRPHLSVSNGVGDAKVIADIIHQSQLVRISEIQPPLFQPRLVRCQGAIDELAQSIRLYGVLQPVIVRPVPSGFELIAGSRRVEAAQRAGRDHISATVVRVTDGKAEGIAFWENNGRVDLSGWEEAQAVGEMRERRSSRKEDVTNAAMARELALSGGWVSERLTIFNGLTKEICDSAGASREELVRLSVAALLRAAKRPSPEDRVVALRLEVARLTEPGLPTSTESQAKGRRGKKSKPTQHKAFKVTAHARRGGITMWIDLDRLKDNPEELPSAQTELSRLMDAVNRLVGETGSRQGEVPE